MWSRIFRQFSWPHPGFLCEWTQTGASHAPFLGVSALLNKCPLTTQARLTHHEDRLSIGVGANHIEKAVVQVVLKHKLGFVVTSVISFHHDVQLHRSKILAKATCGEGSNRCLCLACLKDCSEGCLAKEEGRTHGVNRRMASGLTSSHWPMSSVNGHTDNCQRCWSHLSNEMESDTPSMLGIVAESATKRSSEEGFPCPRHQGGCEFT